MSTLRFISVILLFISVSQNIHPNKYYFRNLQVEDGLSQNMVYTIIQDNQGFIWLGTQDGLNRYDGNNFKIYKKSASDPKGIGSNMIFSLLQNDDGIIWVGTASGVYLYDPLYESFSPLNIKTADNDSISGTVRDMKRDGQGNIWLITSGNGLFCVTPQNELKLYQLEKKLNINSVNTRKLAFDSKGNIWIATYQQGILRFNPEMEDIQQFHIGDNNNSSTINVNDLFLLNDETMLLGTATRGVVSFDLNTFTQKAFLEKDKEGRFLFVRRIYKNTNGELWLGTESGIHIYNLQTEAITNLQHIYGDSYSISDNAIHSIYQDKEGGMWVGSFFGGVNYCNELYSQFEKYYPLTGINTISGKSISEFCEDEKQNVWIATEDAGLNLFNPKNQTFDTGFIPAKNIHGLLYENNNIWVGTFSEGLYVIDIRTNKKRLYKHSSDHNSLNDNSIYSIYKDYSGTIWIGTTLGLHKYNKSTDDFQRINEQEITKQVNDILEDQNGVLWFATLGNGLFSYDKYSNKWTNYPYLTADVNSNMITCILKDNRNRLWLGTEGAGLCMFDTDKKEFISAYTTENGLPNDVVYMLVEDTRGDIWGSTNNGLFRINTNNKQISTFNHANGLLCDQFNYKSGFKSSDSKIYFGGTRGFVAFYPEKLWPNNFVPPIVFNSFQVHNNEVVPTEKNSLLTRSIAYTDEISIPYGTPVFSIGYAALSYVSPRANHYAYKLEGKDHNWINSDGSYKATYSDLPPGDYIFKVMASNSDGLWNEAGASIKIRILPPFYMTIWAYILYVLVAAFIFYYLIKSYTRKVNEKNRQIIEMLEISKEKELYNAKIEFFTNVTHEIRTPLSLIKAPLEEVMKQIDRKDEKWENMSIIQRNTNRLLKLVNELLDFRKTESKGLRLNFVNTDVISVIKETADRFIPSIQLKGIFYNQHLPEQAFYADVDIEIYTKILSNLFNNALKHGHTYINVEFIAGTDTFKFIVSNDGNNISEEYIQKVFDPFFKIDNNTEGSGLGLPFARSLVELHKGSITLDNKKQGEVTFIIELPVHQEDVIQLTSQELDEIEEIKKEHTSHNDDPLKIDNRKVILSVEDNEEFQQFMAKQLNEEYQVLMVQNGQQALDTLSTHHVDIILCDIMMPVMDGLTFCKEIKMNLRYSHIPIILLTAKTSLKSKIDGLNIGADEYIEKPYSIDYLKARIENLLENRKKIKESYKNSPELNYDTIAHSKADEDFLNNLIAIIHSHLDETELDVDKLAAAMNMSRATLYRKVKNISELTPNDFIRLIRLKKAAELLVQKEYRVNEIAYIVGFRSSSYFSKCFQKQFGVLPKDFEKSRIPE
ncbi:hybrid sensor histidine kinase/response regulator transcription factor [Prevotella sp. 10(H)]|uniref:hybrid sensor histidine kinase/response regulator n=1 Tax=Prevotella sp. 10(H) TaxID=1158294 RepID=UPI0004A72A39|nr:hybrid sensor histidine kinase/response regulator transcription factor [Prevotella sp. 10(H)]